MAREIDFIDGLTVVPGEWLNAMQEVLSSLTLNIVVDEQSSTTIRVQAGTDDDVASIVVDGELRYVSSNINLVLSGAADTYNIYATADTPDRAWALEASTGASGATKSRKIAEVDWDGSAITEIRNLVDHQSSNDVTVAVTNLGNTKIGFKDIGYSQVVKDKNPVAAWSFEDNDASVVEDLMGTHDGVGTNVDVQRDGAIAGESSKCFEFAQVDSGVAIPYHAALNTSQFTVNVWVRMDSTASANRAIIDNRSSPSGFDGFAIYCNPADGNIQVTTGNGAGLNGDIQGNGILREGVWSMITMTYDGTNRRTYQDGVLRETTAVSYSPNPSSDFTIGAKAYPASGLNSWIGGIDEVSLYNVALPDDEIAELHDAGFDSSDVYTNKRKSGREFSVQSKNPVSYWKLDDTRGTIAKDSSGSNDGTYVNGTLGQAPLIPDGGKSYYSELGRVDVPAFPELASTEFTISAWVSATSSIAAEDCFWSTRQKPGTAGGVDIRMASSGGRISLSYYDSGATLRSWNPLVSLAPGKVYHVVLIRTSTEWKLYVDGEFKDSTTDTYSVAPGGLRLGRFISDGSRNWNGYIDDVAYWDSILTDKEILEIFRGDFSDMYSRIDESGYTRYIKSLGPVAHWPMDDNGAVGRLRETIGGHIGYSHDNDPIMGQEPIIDEEFGRSLYLDGLSQIRARYHAFLNTSVFTASIWLKPSDMTAGTRRIFGHNTALNKGWRIFQQADVLQVQTGNGTGVNNTNAGSQFKLDEPVHVVFGYDGTDVFIYVNGKEVVRMARTFAVADTSDLFFGYNTGDDYQGYMQHACVYDRVLTDDEIWGLFGRRHPVRQSALMSRPVISGAMAVRNWLADIISETVDPDDVTTTMSMVDGRLMLMPFVVPEPTIVRGVVMAVSTQGSVTADNENRVGLYKSDGTDLTLVASVADDGTLWEHAVGLQEINFDAPYHAEPGVYWVGTLSNWSAAAVVPQFRAAPTTSNPNPVASRMKDSAVIPRAYVSGVSTLPSTQAWSSVTAQTARPWMGLY